MIAKHPTLVLPPTPSSVREARRFAEAHCRQWLPDHCDSAVLLVSEVVTNAVRHAGTAVQLQLTHAPPLVRVEVRDQSATPPCQRTPDVGGGRGLYIIDALARSWGVIQHPEVGKTVWFDIG